MQRAAPLGFLLFVSFTIVLVTALNGENATATDNMVLSSGDSSAYEGIQTGSRGLLQARVVHGVPARSEQFPYTGYLEIQPDCSSFNGANPYICGSSLIMPRVLVTAGHCVQLCSAKPAPDLLPGEQRSPTTDVMQWSPITAYLNETNYNQFGSLSTVEIGSVGTLRHPLYGFDSSSDNPTQYDIALVWGSTGVSVSPVRFADYAPSVAGQPLQVAGWGYTNPYSYSLSNILMTATVPFVPLPKCSSIYGYQLWSGFLCAGSNPANYADTCAGDSGGPIVMGGTGAASTHRLVGSTSYGFGCADSHPGVYQSLVPYKDWIDQQITLNNAGGAEAPQLKCQFHVGHKYTAKRSAILHSIPNAAQCCNACKVYNRFCSSWSWDSQTNRCFIMSSITGRQLSSGWTSGNVTGSITGSTSYCETEYFVQYKDSSGRSLQTIAVYPRTRLAGLNPAECCVACRITAACTHMTYNQVLKTCTLFKGPGQTGGWARTAWQNDYVSGIVYRKLGRSKVKNTAHKAGRAG